MQKGGIFVVCNSPLYYLHDLRPGCEQKVNSSPTGHQHLESNMTVTPRNLRIGHWCILSQEITLLPLINLFNIIHFTSRPCLHYFSLYSFIKYPITKNELWRDLRFNPCKFWSITQRLCTNKQVLINIKQKIYEPCFIGKEF